MHITYEYRVMWHRPHWQPGTSHWSRRHFQRRWAAERLYDRIKYHGKYGPTDGVSIERRPVGNWTEGIM